MARRHYDFIAGLGGACCCSQALRAAGLQFASLPFDWVAGSDIRTRADQIRDDFAGWLPKDALEPYQFETTNTGVVMRNVRTGVVFPHDFHRDVPFDVEWPQVAAKCRRRIDRLSRLVERSKRVLIVWIDVRLSPFATDEDVGYVLNAFRTRWPHVTFELLHLRHEEGLSFESRADVEADGVRTVAFDYRDRRQKYWLADHEAIGRWLAREYAVADYRTPEERANGRRIARAKRYARFRASGFADYLRTKLEYKLFVHLRKRLERKGVV